MRARIRVWILLDCSHTHRLASFSDLHIHKQFFNFRVQGLFSGEGGT